MCIKVDREDGLFLANDAVVTHNTTLCAFAVHWFLTTRYCSKVPIVAPTFSKQIKSMIFSEIHSWRKKSLLHDIYASTQTKMGIVGAEDIWFAEGVAAEDPNKVEGFHAPGGVLYVLDEAKGIDKKIWDAARGALTGDEDRMLAVSTPPLAPIGEFVRVFTHLRSTWKTFYVPPTPRQSKQWRKDREREWPKGSPEYISKVLGEIPKHSTDRTVIPVALVEEAMRRKATQADLDGVKRIGCDVARHGMDETVIAVMHGKVVLPLECFPKQSTAITAQLLREILPAYDTLQIDAIGMGAGVVDMVNLDPSLRDKVIPIEAHDTSPEPDRFYDLGTWMWFEFVKWLEGGGILPYDDAMASQLVTREFQWVFKRGVGTVRKLVSKDDMRRKNMKSPDRADAVILAAIPVRVTRVAMLSQEDMEAIAKEAAAAKVGDAEVATPRPHADLSPEERHRLLRNHFHQRDTDSAASLSRLIDLHNRQPGKKPSGRFWRGP